MESLPGKVEVFIRAKKELNLDWNNWKEDIRPCAHLVLKWFLGNWVPDGQLRHITIYTCIYHASPIVQLTTWVKILVLPRSLKMQHTFIIVLHSNHIYQCSSPFFCVDGAWWKQQFVTFLWGMHQNALALDITMGLNTFHTTSYWIEFLLNICDQITQDLF